MDKCYLCNSCKVYANNECDMNNFCIKKYKTDCLFNAALISEKQRVRIGLVCDADGTDTDKFKQLSDFCKNVEREINNGSNLYIYSTNVGNGKSSWALRIAQEYINKIWYKSDIACKVLFVNVSRFLLSLKNRISQQDDYADYIKKNILTADLVIWDDIATKGTTEFENENLLSIINTRIDQGKSNIYTSNVGLAQLEQTVGARLASRLIGRSLCIELNGMDKRGLNISTII